MRGEYPTAVFAAGFLPFFALLVIGVVKAQVGWVDRRCTFDATGTDFRSGPLDTAVLNVWAAGPILSGIVFVWYAPQDGLAIPLDDDDRIYYPIVVGGLVCWLCYCLWRAISRGSWGYLKLSPDGFEVADVVRITATGSWADVVDVVDVAPKGSNGRCPAVMVMKDGPPQVINALDAVWPYGNALYWMIRHYWLHPESRGELTNGRAIERLRAEEFEVE